MQIFVVERVATSRNPAEPGYREDLEVYLPKAGKTGTTLILRVIELGGAPVRPGEPQITLAIGQVAAATPRDAIETFRKYHVEQRTPEEGEVH